MMKCKNLFFGFLFLAACDRVSSRLENQAFNPPENQKAQCAAPLQNSCWAASVSLLKDCLGDQPAEGLLSEDRQFCQSSDGLLVHFLNPLQQEENSQKFDVYRDGKKCFRLEKKGEDFKVTQTAFGELKVTHQANGDVKVQCFFGEQTLLTSEFIGNCLQPDVEETRLPTAAVKTSEKENLRHFMFSFVGLGLPATPVFSCQSE